MNEITTLDFYQNQEKFDTVARVSSALAKSNIIPMDFRNKPENVLIALDMALRMNTSPMQVMQSLYIVNGRPSWSSQYIIGVINSSGRYRHELMFDVQGSGDSLSCYAWTTTKTGEKICGPLITMAMAKAEGWLGKTGSKWRTMPEVMIRYRAASFFGRLYCSDLIMGIYSQEEAYEIPPENVIISDVQEVKEEKKAEKKLVKKSENTAKKLTQNSQNFQPQPVSQLQNSQNFSEPVQGNIPPSPAEIGDLSDFEDTGETFYGNFVYDGSFKNGDFVDINNLPV
jgi:hypothetical protein